MDDIIVVPYMLDHLHSQELLSILADLFNMFGITSNSAKSVTLPSTEVEYLSIFLSTVGKLCLTAKCIAIIKAAANSFLCYMVAHHRIVPMQQLWACAGFASLAYTCYQFASLFAHCMYSDLGNYFFCYCHDKHFSLHYGFSHKHI